MPFYIMNQLHLMLKDTNLMLKDTKKNTVCNSNLMYFVEKSRSPVIKVLPTLMYFGYYKAWLNKNEDIYI